MFATTIHAASTQFSDPRLVAIFDTINPIDGYRDFYLGLAKELAPRTILDVGSGTGLLSCELSRRGHHVVGVEPAPALLDKARQRGGCDNVRWVQGYVTELSDVRADLAFMTGHVAQLFLTDEGWQEALLAIRQLLNQGGHLAFESRNPLIPPFQGWPTRDAPVVAVDPVAGEIAWWFKLLRTDENRVQYELHYHFARSGEEVVSTDELKFRSREEIGQSLTDAGYLIDHVFGDWDRTGVGAASPEMIFVARSR